MEGTMATPFDEAGFVEALDRARADERLPPGTYIRDLGWPGYESRHFELITAYAPPLIQDGRDHDHLRTSTSLGGGWRGERLAEAVEKAVERHVEEWGFLARHTTAEPFHCDHIAR
jgi:hypothetical protein